MARLMHLERPQFLQGHHNEHHTPSLSCMGHAGTNIGQTKSTLCSDLEPPPILKDLEGELMRIVGSACFSLLVKVAAGEIINPGSSI